MIEPILCSVHTFTIADGTTVMIILRDLDPAGVSTRTHHKIVLQVYTSKVMPVYSTYNLESMMGSKLRVDIDQYDILCMGMFHFMPGSIIIL